MDNIVSKIITTVIDFLWITEKFCLILILLFIACDQLDFKIDCRFQIVNILLETASFSLFIISTYTLKR